MSKSKSSEDIVLTFGKYNNEKLSWIIKNDPSYCHYLLYSFKGYLPKYIKEVLEPVFPNPKSYFLTFGGYKGWDLLDIKKEDPGYITFLLNDPYIKKNCEKLYEKLLSLSTA
jgi:hypothetical protein